MFTEEVADLVGLNMGDLNGDGIADFVVVSETPYGAPQLTVMLGRGTQPSKAASLSLPAQATTSLVPGFYNGDGSLDLALYDVYDAVVSVLAGNNDGTFQAPTNFGVEAAPYCMLSGQFQPGAKTGENNLVLCTSLGFEVLLNETQ